MITVRRLLSACALAAISAMPHAAIAGDMLLIHGHIYAGAVPTGGMTMVGGKIVYRR
jgi:hypothetical protein